MLQRSPDSDTSSGKAEKNSSDLTPELIERFSNENPYTVLGVSENATAEEIKEARKALVLQYHQDVGGEENQNRQIVNIVQNVNAKYDELISKEGKLRLGRNGATIITENPFTDPEAGKTSAWGKTELRVKERESYARNLVEDIKSDIESNGLPVALDTAKRAMVSISSLYNITSEEVLSMVDNVLFESFIKDTKKNLDSLSIEDASVITNHMILQMTQLGMNREKIFHLISNLKNDQNQGLMIQEEFNESESINFFAKSVNDFLNKKENSGGLFNYGTLFLDVQLSLNSLQRMGISREQLIQSIEPIVIQKFVDFVKRQLSYKNDDFNYILGEIKYAFNSFEKFGIEGKKLFESVGSLKNNKDQYLSDFFRQL